MISVVVPAHNEAAVIQRTLRSLVGAGRTPALEIVVVCNGCTDATAELARSVDGPITVVETVEASKTAAMNVADRMLSSFPRVYLDADVELAPGSLLSLVEPLAAGRCDLSLARSRHVVRAGNRLVESYVRFWRRLPQVSAVSAGSGVFALSASGRASFGPWPEIMNDDAFIRMRLADRMEIVAEAVSIVRAPHTIRAMVKRKVRVAYGNRQIGVQIGAARPWTGWIRVLREHPGAVVDLPVYVYVTLAARFLARSGREPDWAADETSRQLPLRPDHSRVAQQRPG